MRTLTAEEASYIRLVLSEEKLPLDEGTTIDGSPLEEVSASLEARGLVRSERAEWASIEDGWEYENSAECVTTTPLGRLALHCYDVSKSAFQG